MSFMECEVGQKNIINRLYSSLKAPGDRCLFLTPFPMVPMWDLSHRKDKSLSLHCMVYEVIISTFYEECLFCS